MEAKCKKVLVIRLDLPGMDMSSAGRSGTTGGGDGPWQLKREHDYTVTPSREWWTLHVDQSNAEATANDLAAAAKAIRETMGL